MGHTVTVAEDARSAYDAFIRQEMQAVIVEYDPALPDRHELIQTFRASGRFRPLIVVLLGREHRKRIGECIRAGTEVVLYNYGELAEWAAQSISQQIARVSPQRTARSVQAEMGRSIVRATADVFEKMLGMPVQPGPVHVDRVSARRADVIGSICVTGCLSGAVSLFMSGECANLAASRMLMSDDSTELTDAEIADSVGELTNMVSGGIKDSLFNRKPIYEVSIPAVYVGHDLQRSPMSDDLCFFVPFECGGEVFAVEFLMVQSAGHLETNVEGDITLCAVAS